MRFSSALKPALLDELRNVLKRMESNPRLYRCMHPPISCGFKIRFQIDIFCVNSVEFVDVIAIRQAACSLLNLKGRR